MTLSVEQLDRAIGTITASAFGDALGQSYEFGPGLEDDVEIVLQSGMTFARGEWTDDTAQAMAIAKAGEKFSLHTEAAQDEIARLFLDWARTAKDIGIQTQSVFGRTEEPTAKSMRQASEEVQRLRPNSAGNGSLMRTGPIALQYLRNDSSLDEAVREISALTHAEQSCIEACLIWSRAIRHAVLHGNFDGVRLTIEQFPIERRDFWTKIVDDAEQGDPRDFTPNGWVVRAFQVAWSALSRVPDNHENPIVAAIESCIRVGDDTDTTAAICGALAGAKWGHSRVPDSFQDLYGWPNMTGPDLVLVAENLTGNQAL